MGFAGLFRILSAHPVPDIVRAIFDNSPVSRLEADLRSRIRVQDPMPPAEMPALAEQQGIPVLKGLTGKGLKLSPAALPAMEKAILGKRRPGVRPTDPLPEESWAPDALFLVLGAALGLLLAPPYLAWLLYGTIFNRGHVDLIRSTGPTVIE